MLPYDQRTDPGVGGKLFIVLIHQCLHGSLYIGYSHLLRIFVIRIDLCRYPVTGLICKDIRYQRITVKTILDGFRTYILAVA